MKFLLFICCLWAMGWFYRQEHLRYVATLKNLQQTLRQLPPDKEAFQTALTGQDWRLVSLSPRHTGLKRAFHVQSRKDVLRYGLPLVFLALMMIFLQSWLFAAIYGALVCVKWFALTTRLSLSPHGGRYDVMLFGFRLFGEDLSP